MCEMVIHTLGPLRICIFAVTYPNFILGYVGIELFLCFHFFLMTKTLSYEENVHFQVHFLPKKFKTFCGFFKCGSQT